MLVDQTPVPHDALPVARFKAHLRLGTGFADDDLQDDLLTTHLRAAMAAIEARTGKILIARDVFWTVTAWRDAYRAALPVAPVAAISQVMVINRLGVATPVPASRWALEIDTHRPRLVSTSGALPQVPQGGSVRIGLLAGFGPEWSDLPHDLAQAVFLLAAHFYEYRHATPGAEIPLSVSALITPYRNIRLFTGGRS